MRHRVGLAVVIGLFATRTVAAPPRLLVGDGLLVLRGATLIDGTGTPPRSDSLVAIRKGRIVAVGARTAFGLPAGATVLDLRGRTLIPGLMDLDARVLVNVASAPRHDRLASAQILRQLLALGVTTVRHPTGPTRAAVALREAVASGRLLGPRVLASGNPLDGAPPHLTEPQIRAEVRRQAIAGVDLVSLGPSLTPPLVRAALHEAHRHGRRVFGRLQRTTWTKAAKARIDALTGAACWSQAYLPPMRREAHRQSLKRRGARKARLDWLDWLDPDRTELQRMVWLIARRRISVTPSLVSLSASFGADDPQVRSLFAALLTPLALGRSWSGAPEDAGWTAVDVARGRALWPKLLRLIKLYEERGVLLTVGTGTPGWGQIPGISLHRELQMLAEAGVPPLQVIRIATRNNAAALGVLEDVGTLEVGKRADLLVLGGDPVRDICNTRRIESVILGGEPFAPQHLLEPVGFVSRRRPSPPRRLVEPPRS